MVGVTLKLEGEAQLMEALRKLGADAQAEARKAVEATAIEVLGDIKRGYQRGPASGRVYVRGNVRHQASAPGEAPATDGGDAARRSFYRMTGDMSAEVENQLDYPAMLEWGTQNIAPRPLWRPTVIKAQPKFQRRMETALARVMK